MTRARVSTPVRGSEDLRNLKFKRKTAAAGLWVGTLLVSFVSSWTLGNTSVSAVVVNGRL